MQFLSRVRANGLKLQVRFIWDTMACVNASSRNGSLGTLGQFHPPKVGIGAKCDSENLQNSHFQNFQAFYRGDHMVLLHFYAIQAISYIEVCLRIHFYLMHSHDCALHYGLALSVHMPCNSRNKTNSIIIHKSYL